MWRIYIPHVSSERGMKSWYILFVQDFLWENWNWFMMLNCFGWWRKNGGNAFESDRLWKMGMENYTQYEFLLSWGELMQEQEKFKIFCIVILPVLFWRTVEGTIAALFMLVLIRGLLFSLVDFIFFICMVDIWHTLMV